MASGRLIFQLVLVAGLLAVWLVLTGGAAPWVGLAVALIAAAATSWLNPRSGTRGAIRFSPLAALPFAAYFLVESVRGGLDVAYRAFHPELPIAPDWVRHKLRVRQPAGRRLLVAVVSLLPGTLAVRLEGDAVLIHCLTPAGRAGIDRLDRHIAALFAESPARPEPRA